MKIEVLLAKILTFSHRQVQMSKSSSTLEFMSLMSIARKLHVMSLEVSYSSLFQALVSMYLNTEYQSL